MKRFLFVIFFFAFQPLLFGLSFGPFISISQGGTNSAPQVAVAANGNAFAVWSNFPNLIQTAFFNAAINPPTGAWSAPVNLATGIVPQIGIDQNGNAFVAWVSTVSTTANQILVTRFNATSMAFAPFVQLSTSGTNFNPQIAVNGVGVAVVIWQNIPAGVLSASFVPMTGTWTSPIQLSTTTPPANFALDNFNRGIAIFSTQPQGVVQATRIFAP